MNAKIRWVVLLICVAAWNAYGAFEKPTREQLKAAAKEVSLLVALLTPTTAAAAGGCEASIKPQMKGFYLNPTVVSVQVSGRCSTVNVSGVAKNGAGWSSTVTDRVSSSAPSSTNGWRGWSVLRRSARRAAPS